MSQFSKDLDFMDKALESMYKILDEALKQIFNENLGGSVTDPKEFVPVDPHKFNLLVYVQSVVFLDYTLRAQETYSLLTNSKQCLGDAEAYKDELEARLSNLEAKHKKFVENLTELSRKSLH